MISKDLVMAVADEFKLKPNGRHGLAHWARVLENGRILAEKTGAHRSVVELFAIFHDCKRRNDRSDPDHGKRAAAFAETLRGLLFELDDTEFNLLYDACCHHSDGGTAGHITLLTCWDADRLDIPRFGKTIDPERLGTEAARDPELIASCQERAGQRLVPEFVLEDWGVSLEVTKKSSWF